VFFHEIKYRYLARQFQTGEDNWYQTLNGSGDFRESEEEKGRSTVDINRSSSSSSSSNNNNNNKQRPQQQQAAETEQ